MSDLIKVMKGIRKRLTPRRAWIKGEFARTAPRGAAVPATSELAKCWCLRGAANAEPRPTIYVKNFLDDLARERGFNSMVDFNDRPKTKHADVLAFLDAAIRKARKAACP